jgi:hypothetical protein
MNVSELMKDVRNGLVVLPDFQRSFIWEPEDVRQLLVSVLGDYFIGTMLVLEDFKDDSQFALRLIEGVEEANPDARIQSIVRILLDGQQRATALFYSLHEPDLPLKGRKSSYRFYLNLERALKDEWDDAVVAVSSRDRGKLKEIRDDRNILPFSKLMDIGKLAQLYADHQEFPRLIQLANDFMNRSIQTVPLKRGTSPDRIVETFERINRTGEPLSVFELLTARLYRDQVKLRDLLETAMEDYEFPSHAPPEFILRVVALLRGLEPKRRNVLALKAADFGQDWSRACKALEYADKRLTDIKNGYGVLDFKKWAPYATMLVPLAAMIEYVKTNNLETEASYAKIDRWYWVSVFSNAYDQAVETISMTHFNAVRDWIGEDKVPPFIQKFSPTSVDLDVDKQSSAVYRGAIALIVLKGALDFKTGQPPQFGIEKVQDDHIFPKSAYHDHHISNRTLISTNAEKGSKKPSEYFKQRLADHGEQKLATILESHIIPRETLGLLLADDIGNFMEKRRQAIINELSKRIEYRSTPA